MADFKNIITGTVANIVGKVKEVAESGAVKEIYEQGTNKVKSYGQIAKLSLELTGDKEELKKLFADIGRLYFEETQEPDSFFAPLFDQTRAVYQRIQEKEELIAALKAADCEGCCDEECCCEGDVEVEICEFEEVVEATEAEGCCAEPCVEEAPAAEKTPEEEVKE